MRGSVDDGWIAFLNREAQELAKLEPTLSRGVLRASLCDRLGETYDFPLRTFVRALVTGERFADAPDSLLPGAPRAAPGAAPNAASAARAASAGRAAPVARGASTAATVRARRHPQPRLLELWPAGLDRTAAALTGPLVVPCERLLGPGSVLTAAVVLEDPRRQRLAGPGLVARLVDYSVEVAVEP